METILSEDRKRTEAWPATRVKPAPAQPHRAEAMIRRHWPAIRRFARVLGADAATADDLAQDVFVVALRKGVEDLGDDAALAFLRTTTRNLLRNQRRRHRPVLMERMERVWETRERTADLREAALRSCMEQLAPRSQQAIRLAYGERRSRDSIAATLGIRQGGVKSLMRRARAVLKECVERSLASQGGPS